MKNNDGYVVWTDAGGTGISNSISIDDLKDKEMEDIRDFIKDKFGKEFEDFVKWKKIKTKLNEDEED